MESLGNIDQEVCEVHTQVRTNPTSIVSHLQEMLANFDGMVLKRPGKINLRTNEGAAAV